MSKVDDIFVQDLKEIMEQEWEVDNRAKWKDGSQVKTKRILQVSHKYDLSEGFPILSLRNINFNKAVDEALWIYSKMSNNVKDISSSIWDSWKDDNGYVHKAYGYQIAKPTMGYPSQMHYVLDEIKKNPTSRRIQTSMFSVEDQLEKAQKSLIECAFALKFSVKDNKLHMTLDQRSGDFLVAASPGGWNLTQYAFLQHAIARECKLEVGILKHDIQDLHLYNKHVDQLNMMLDRYDSADNYSLPTIKIADKPFFELTADDVELIGYEHQGGIGKIEVAV